MKSARLIMAFILAVAAGRFGGVPLATAMVRPATRAAAGFRPIVVGKANADPYPEHGPAIEALGRQLGVTLDRATCYPYRR